jgi:uncharacterized integral membrane protein
VTVATQPAEQSVQGLAPTELSAVESPDAPRLGRTRISAAWFGIVATALVPVLLLIFILQNTRSVKITYVTASGTIPVGVALLFAAIGGLLLAGLMASLRIWQLHHRLAQGGSE